MTVLVIGGTGTVGSAVASGLARQGVSIRCMTRVADKIQDLPKGVQGVVGDLSKPNTLKAAFKGVESVFLVTPLSQNETVLGLGAVAAAKSAGVKRIVYMSVPMPPGSTHVPHFASKIPVENEIKKSGMSYTVLRPNNLFQNDFWVQAAVLMYHVYPQPIGMVGLNRVDARDVANAAINALTTGNFVGKEYAIHGPDKLTGEDCAQIFGRHLNREVHYAGDDLNNWARQSQHMMPQWMVQDLRIMYEYLQQHGSLASAEELARTAEIVGHAPRRYEDFVKEVVPGWVQASQS